MGTHEFAGVRFKLTSRGLVRRPTYLRILRSGAVHVRCTGRYTDDYARDNDDNFGRHDLTTEAAHRLADEIESDPSGWWCSVEEDGSMHLGCHSFLGYRVVDDLVSG